MVLAVQSLLNFLFSKNALTEKQCQALSPKMDQFELAHYYSLPKPPKVNDFSRRCTDFSWVFFHWLLEPGTRLTPIIASVHSPKKTVSKFLTDLLASMFLKVARETTFINCDRCGEKNRELCCQWSFQTNNGVYHCWCHWSLHDDTLTRCFRRIRSILCPTFHKREDRSSNYWSNYENDSIDSWFNLFCLKW